MNELTESEKQEINEFLAAWLSECDELYSYVIDATRTLLAQQDKRSPFSYPVDFKPLFTDSVDSCRLVTNLLSDEQKRDYAFRVENATADLAMDFSLLQFESINAAPAILAQALHKVLKAG